MAETENPQGTSQYGQSVELGGSRSLAAAIADSLAKSLPILIKHRIFVFSLSALFVFGAVLVAWGPPLWYSVW